MYPDILNTPPDNKGLGPSFPNESSRETHAITVSTAIQMIHLNGYQEPHPWICSIIFEETQRWAEPGYFGQSHCSIPGKIICGVNPDSTVFAVSVPSGVYHEIRQLSREIPVSFPDLRSDVAFPVGHWSEGENKVFPAIVENEDQHLLFSSIMRVGGTMRKLNIGYLIFTQPPSQTERAVLFEKMRTDPVIRFVMLEFPEG